VGFGVGSWGGIGGGAGLGGRRGYVLRESPVLLGAIIVQSSKFNINF